MTSVMPFSREEPQRRLPGLRTLDRHLEPSLRHSIDKKAKPLGSLGRLEDLAVHVGLITGSALPRPGKAAAVIFAGDHGLVAQGVTAYQSEVTALIVQMALDGVAGVNIAARAVDAEVFVVDAGLKSVIEEQPRLIDLRIAAGTRNSYEEPAMTEAEALSALWAGYELAVKLKADGFGILALGEIGIGNSSAAALLAHALTQRPIEELVGLGAGAPKAGVSYKLETLVRTYARAPVKTGLDALREFGGYEMAMLAGALIGGAASGAVVLVDGFIATACACAAVDMEPNLKNYLVFAHLSPERGHAALLHWLNAKPLLDLGLRLGEGTGAILSIPLIRMAEAMLRDMADLP